MSYYHTHLPILRSTKTSGPGHYITIPADSPYLGPRVPVPIGCQDSGVVTLEVAVPYHTLPDGSSYALVDGYWYRLDLDNNVAYQEEE